MTSQSLDRLSRLEATLERVNGAFEFQGKKAILVQDTAVDAQLAAHPALRLTLLTLSSRRAYIILSLLCIGQKHIVLQADDLDRLAASFEPMEAFFRKEGGILGYHAYVLRLLEERYSRSVGPIAEPPTIDIREESRRARFYVLFGLKHLDEVAEACPVGGAADRLNLTDPVTNRTLPAAKLGFFGKCLFERLIDDIQAREYLHYRIFHKAVVTPIALMTSEGASNHRQVVELCEKNAWFGRGRAHFFFFSQPLVPCVDEHGDWVPGEMKPGGHGVLWRLAREKGVFDALRKCGRSKLLLRQINNPIGGTDYGMLAFLGLGMYSRKAFGFLSCERKTGAKEGMNVAVETERGRRITNIEYCDAAAQGCAALQLPANTNILYADITALQPVIRSLPLPGKILNFSSKGTRSFARLETTMQNIADELDADDVYIAYNRRAKTIAATKKQYVAGQGIDETPLGALYASLKNGHELLGQRCGVALPDFPSRERFEKMGPSYLFQYHPALGPLYSIIAQKIRGGSIASQSMLDLEIAELCIEELHLNGSLSIYARDALGYKDADGILHYSENGGACLLRNVHIDLPLPHSQGLLTDMDACKKLGVEICIEGSGRFEAEHVTFTRAERIDVPDGVCMRAFMDGTKVCYETLALKSAAPLWEYSVSDEYEICLHRK